MLKKLHLFKKEKVLALFLFIFATILPLHVAHGSVVKGDDVRILFISETHGLGGSSATWRTSTGLLTERTNVSSVLGNLGLTQTTFTNADQAVSSVNTQIRWHLDRYVHSVAAYMRNNNYNTARVAWYFSFIDAGDNSEQKKVYLPLIIYPDGNIRNLGARVIDTVPTILYYIYRPRAVEGNLPAGWAFPDGGVLHKFVLDQHFNIISSSSVNKHGRFDPPVTPIGESVLNPNAGLELLISEVVVPEMRNKGALFSIIDYSRNPAPVFDCNEQGHCVARVSVESHERIFYPDVSGGCYTTRGVIGYTISFQTERYFVEPSGNYVLTAISTGMAVAQPQEFAKTVPISSSPDFHTIIDPFHTFTLYRFNNDTVNHLPCNNYLFAGQACSQAPVQVRNCTTDCSRPYDSGIIGTHGCFSGGLFGMNVDICNTDEGLPGETWCGWVEGYVYGCVPTSYEPYCDYFWRTSFVCSPCQAAPPLISHTVCATAGIPIIVSTYQHITTTGGRRWCVGNYFIAIRDSFGKVVAIRDGRWPIAGCWGYPTFLYRNSFAYTPSISGIYTVQIWMYNAVFHRRGLGFSSCRARIETTQGHSCPTGNHFLRCN